MTAEQIFQAEKLANPITLPQTRFESHPVGLKLLDELYESGKLNILRRIVVVCHILLPKLFIKLVNVDVDVHPFIGLKPGNESLVIDFMRRSQDHGCC
jgi:hypothetical protein